MKNSLLTFLMLIIYLRIFAQFAGGDGTGFFPYYITTPEHLSNIMMQDDEDNYLYLDCYFFQGADIDLSDAEWSAGEGWQPLGTAANPFTGNYDGYGYTISDLTINRPLEDNIGLFGYVREACLFNINLENVDVTGRDNVGTLVGYSLASSINLKGQGPVWPSNYKCSVSGSVSGNNYIGGLVGIANYCEAIRCFSNSDVTGNSYIGGVIGSNELGTYSEPIGFWEDTWIITPGKIQQTYSTGDINGSGDIIGGLVGKNSAATIRKCYSTCNVTTEGINIGGLIGLNTDAGQIINCYSSEGTIIGEGSIAGLVGHNLASTITNCYTKTIIFGTDTYVEGLVGRDSGTITNSYWDTEISGISEPGNGDGRTTADMTFPYAVDTFVDWNFAITWQEDEDLGEGTYKDGYPYLQWEHQVIKHDYAGGSGTEADPYLIATTYQLNNVREELDAHYLQIANIDLDEFPYNDGSGWIPIGIDGEFFSGSYNGGGFTISNMMIDRTGWGNENSGLFGVVDGSLLQNIVIETASITGYSYVGGIAGNCSNTTITYCSFNGNLTAESTRVGGLVGFTDTSSIDNCYNAGIIIGYSRVGGLIGQNENSTIQLCYSSGSVTGDDNYVGGLVGLNYSGSVVQKCYSTSDVVTPGGQFIGGAIGGNWLNAHISNSYATGYVNTGSTYTGGFIGNNPTGCSVIYCFSTGLVTAATAGMGFLGQGPGVISGSYWNTETSGCPLSGGDAIGRITSEMTSPYDVDTYTGWDFTTIWAEDSDYSRNNGYPYIQGIEYSTEEFEEPSSGDILINEVCGDDVHPALINDGYIELFNVRPFDVSLENVEVRYYDNGSEEPQVMALSGVIEANEYIVICQNFAAYVLTYGFPPADFEAPIVGETSLFPLDGGEDTIEIYVNDSSKAGTVDRFNNPASPWVWVASDLLERINTGDGGTQTNWGPGDGNPGDDDDPLPATLSSFTAVLQEGSTLLQWRTDSETDNFGWNVYRGNSIDTASNEEMLCLNFDLIPGAGTCSTPTNYYFEDTQDLISDHEYWYWLESMDVSGITNLFGPISIIYSSPNEPEVPEIPLNYGLQQNFPNPFNPETMISFVLSFDSTVDLSVYNIKGQLVKNLYKNKIKKDEVNEIIWSGLDNKNRQVASGVYFYKLKTEKRDYIRKMILMK